MQAGSEKIIQRVTWVGLLINLVLTAFKFAAGILGNSQAVVADAVHSLSDMSTDAAILIGVRHWNRPPDQRHPRGHQRIEMLVTIFIGLMLLVVAGGIVYNALSTLGEPHRAPPGWIACIAAGCSIVVKELLYRWTAAWGRKIGSSSMVANAWHHRSDAFSSIPAMAAVLGSRLVPSWPFLDHVGAVVVGLLIVQAALKILLEPLDKLLDRGAPEEVEQEIMRIAVETGGVKAIHRLRTRYRDCTQLEVDLHVKVDGDLSVRAGHDIAELVRKNLQKEMPQVVDVITHLEPFPSLSTPSERLSVSPSRQ